MRADHSNDFKIGEKYEWREEMFQSDRRMRRGAAFNPTRHFTFVPNLRRLMQGMGKLLIAIRYSLGRIGGLPKFHLGSMPFFQRIPWWKLGLAALAVFIVMKKDIQLSIDMKAPMGAAPHDDESRRSGEELEELGAAQSIALYKGEAYSPASADELDNDRVREYVERFAPIAAAEMKKFGIPASIKMAQALTESHAGMHPATREMNNHFGRPFAGNRFKNAWESWREHSLMLYHEHPKLFELEKDYETWAKALDRLPYSRERRYDRKLIEIVEKYQLYLLDEE